ncbi:MAG: glycosyltransferase [Opitutae bacterium]|nr:glycosyltransferase [Opitutae bacterium]
MAKNRVLFAIPALLCGGMERVMSILVNYCAEEKPDYEIHLLLYAPATTQFYKIHPRVVVHQIKGNFSSKPTKFIFLLKSLLFLRREIKTLSPVAVLSFGDLQNLFFSLATVGFKFPRAISFRSNPVPITKRGKLRLILEGMLLRRVDLVIAQTRLSDTIFKSCYGVERTCVIGNPIPDFNVELRTRENLVISVGRLIPSKSHEELILLFAKIRKPGWKLIIVGGDIPKSNRLQKLRELVKNLDADDYIELVGAQKNVSDYLLRASIFAFPSLSEGFPNALAEGMSAGLPSVSFDISGVSDLVVDGESGFIVPPRNFEMFADKLSLLMERDDLRSKFSIKAKESAANFSEGKICEKFWQALTQLNISTR